MTVDDPTDISKLRDIIDMMLHDAKRRDQWKKNAAIAARELCWENEQIRLKNIYSTAGIVFK